MVAVRSSVKGLASVGAITVALGSAGCASVPLFKVHQEEVRPHTAGEGLHIETRNGGVKVIEVGGSDITVSADVRSATQSRAESATIALERLEGNPDILVVRIEWPDGEWHERDGCTLEVLVPSAVGVTVETSNGNVLVEGLGGGVNAETSNGDIVVKGHEGPVVASSSNGNIEVAGAPGPADIETSNGTVRVTGAAGRVDAETSNGGIRVELAPDNPGPVHLDTSNGTVVLAVGAGFAGVVEAETSNGSVRFGDFGDAFGFNVLELEDDESRVVFKSEGAEASTIENSNGSITVQPLD